MMRNVALSVLAAAALSAAGTIAARAGDCERFPGIPYVQAGGLVDERVANDRARIWIGIVVRGASSEVALTDLSVKSQTLVAAVRNAGVPDDRIQTSGPTAREVFDVTRDPNGREIVEKRVRVGVDAEFGLSVVVDDVDKAEARASVQRVLAAVTKAGGAIRSIGYSVAKEREIRARLDRRAVEIAKAQAKLLAEAAGGRIGRVLAIYDSSHQPFGDDQADLARANSLPSQVHFEVLPGSTTITGRAELVVETLAP